MKIILIMLVCSFTSGTCTPPLVINERFEDMYTCLLRGYEESINMTMEVPEKRLIKKDFLQDLHAEK